MASAAREPHAPHLPAGAVKRITREIAQLTRDADEMAKCGIFYAPSDSDISRGYALIVGPEDTPYFGGAFFFSVHFPDTYPMVPPIVKSLTQDGETRFNPNLYCCGKVCLSILNTWQGDQWSPSLTVRAVLTSIQALVLHKNPLTNEPAYETSNPAVLSSPKYQKYNAVVSTATFKTAILHVLEDSQTFGAPLSLLASYLAFLLPLRDKLLKHYSVLRDEYYAHAGLKEDVYGRTCLPQFDKWLTRLRAIL